MKLVDNNNGFKEIVITDDCEWSEFYDVAEKIEHFLSIQYFEQVHDFDSAYWLFSYEGTELILHYNVYLGISIYPSGGRESTLAQNQCIVKLLEVLHGLN